ncbi:response regulator transcription factor [Paeniglutamicibacter sp. NPDC091659]|uniref:response regulator transcription factor n=1 Tax=Paeniglutamicibacter sp. NPDC091659 TaxID=3364389 RepID=UPI0037F27001
MNDHRVAVVIEDDEDIRGLLEAVLLQSGFDVHATDSGVKGVELVESRRPDLVTLDLGLPDIDGFETARRIRTISDAHIVMLTARSDEIDTILGLESGADEYVTKPFKPRELRARVDAIMRRRNSQAQAKNEAPAVPAEAQAKTQLGQAEGDLVRSLNGLMLNSSTYTVEVDGEAKNITPTEFTLLDVLLGSNGHIRTKTELVRRLRDEESDSGTYVSSADERSVEVHMGNLRRKLGDSTQDPRWIETVRGVGYRSAAKR